MRPNTSFSVKALVMSCLSLLSLLSIFASAQSPNCHQCIQKAIPTIANCTALTPTQLTGLDTLIHGKKVYETTGMMSVAEPAMFQCLVALMWDIVHYKATLWDKCLDPGVGCPWGEMMHYMEMIPKIASIYGAANPPASILIDGPK